MRDLRGRTAVVTGASGGLVPYITEELARREVNLVLSAPTEAELQPTVERLAGHGVQIETVACDLTKWAELEGLAAAVGDRFGGADILVNGAGVEHTYEYQKLTLGQIEIAMQVNLLAPMKLTRLLLPGMLERGAGHIVCISSVVAKTGGPFSEAYGASKAGLIGFTKSLRAGYRSRGVSASSVVPGFVEAGMYTRVKEEGLRVPRLVGTATPDQVARAVVRAIVRDRAEIVVSPRPLGLQLVAALAEIFPSVNEVALKRLGFIEMSKRWAALNERQSAAVDA